MAGTKLNVDISTAISEFEAVIKEFKLRDIIYRRVFRGRGLEFDSFRNYSSDEDASNIDWKASKRANALLVRNYIEERDLKILFVVDVSEKMIFGSSNKLKCEYMTELIAALAHLIITSKDNIGLVLYKDKISEVLPMNRSLENFYIFVDKLSEASTYGGFSSLNAALDYILKYSDNSLTAVILISDFIGVNRNVEEKLSLVSSRFETISIMIRDSLDTTLPNVNREILIQDPGTGQKMLINPRLVKRQYEFYAQAQERMIRDLFKKYNIDFLTLTTDNPFVIPLATFLKARVERTKGHG